MTKIVTLRVKLLQVSDPEVWRCVSLPAGASLHHLNCAIQYAFGWEDIGTYAFGSERYCENPCLELPETEELMVGHCLKQPGDTLYYRFSDCWLHQVTLERVDECYEAEVECVSGQGACPPYGWGGSPEAYRQLKREFRCGIASEAVEAARQWLELEEGETFDPRRVSFHAIHNRLQIWIDQAAPVTLDSRTPLAYNFYAAWWEKKLFSEEP